VYGPIPVDPNGKPLEVDERCEVTLCVRPDHVQLLTKGDNVRRRGPTRGSGKRASNATAEVQPKIGNSVAETFAIALFTRYDRPAVEPKTVSLEDLIAMLTTSCELADKRQARCWSPTLYADGHTSRANAGVASVSNHPDQWQALRADPERLAGAAVEEALRYEPITPFTARITVADVEHRGVSFPAGTVVLVSAWHANREGVEPDTFDIIASRPRERVLTFGAGIHYCVGANLARAEMTEALTLMAHEVRSVSPAAEPEFGTPSGIYGLERLPLVFRR